MAQGTLAIQDLAFAYAHAPQTSARPFLVQKPAAIEVPARQLIFSQGDTADALYYVEEGCVRVSVVSSSGKEAILAFLREGSFVGESCIMGLAHRLATVYAEIDTRLIKMNCEYAKREMQTNPAFNRMFINHLLSRNTRIEEDLVEQLLSNSEKRLARILLLQANFESDRHTARVPRLSQEVLSEMVGTTRARVNLFMNNFRNAGHIHYSGRDQLIVNDSLSSVLLK